MRRTVQAIVHFTAYQLTETIRRPRRAIVAPRKIGLSILRRAQMVLKKKPVSEIDRAARNIRVSPKIDADVHRILALVMSDLADRAYPSGYQISKRWRAHLRHALYRAGAHPGAAALAYVSLSTFDVELVGLIESERDRCVQNRRDYNRKYNELSLLCDSTISPPNTIVAVDGGTHSTKMDQAFSYYDQICSSIPKNESLKTIAEIGSGNGRFARLMHLLDPSRRYILIDLPESLLFAYAFLSVNFPDAKKLFIASPADARAMASGEFDFIFCPIHFIEKLSVGSVDLALNTYSFCEMPQSSVDYLLDCIHRVLQPHYLYSLNMMFSDKDLNFDTGGWDGDANEASLNLRPEWGIRSFNLTPALVGGKYRLTAGTVLERIPFDSETTAVRSAVAAADQLELGDAARIGNLYFAARWSLDQKLVARFLSELEQYCVACNFPPDSGYEFERIGEVRHLRRLLPKAVPPRPR